MTDISAIGPKELDHVTVAILVANAIVKITSHFCSDIALL